MSTRGNSYILTTTKQLIRAMLFCLPIFYQPGLALAFASSTLFLQRLSLFSIVFRSEGLGLVVYGFVKFRVLQGSFDIHVTGRREAIATQTEYLIVILV